MELYMNVAWLFKKQFEQLLYTSIKASFRKGSTNTTGALNPETLSSVPILSPSHPDFQALCHASYSAILNTEATATLMLLPVCPVGTTH
eukprot:1138117-Pelagomonas_calceolata.AAC.1